MGLPVDLMVCLTFLKLRKLQLMNAVFFCPSVGILPLKEIKDLKCRVGGEAITYTFEGLCVCDAEKQVLQSPPEPTSRLRFLYRVHDLQSLVLKF